MTLLPTDVDGQLHQRHRQDAAAEGQLDRLPGLAHFYSMQNAEDQSVQCTIPLIDQLYQIYVIILANMRNPT